VDQVLSVVYIPMHPPRNEAPPCNNAPSLSPCAYQQTRRIIKTLSEMKPYLDLASCLWNIPLNNLI
jgi:hypothetical protein